MNRASLPSSQNNRSGKNSSATAAVVTGSINSAFSEPPKNKNNTSSTDSIIGDMVSSSSDRTTSSATMNCTKEISNHRSLLLETSSQDQYDRTLKVAKKEYSDHGSHSLVVKTTFLKKMTTSLEDVYHDHTNGPIATTNEISNPSYSISNRSSGNGGAGGTSISKNRDGTDSTVKINKVHAALSPSSAQQEATQLSHKKQTSTNKTESIRNKASSVSMSRQKCEGENDNGNKPTQVTSLLHAALQQQHEIELPNSQQQNECLTNPSEPHSNGGLDNIEGNLIVHKNNTIRVINQKLHEHKTSTRSSPKKETVVSQLKTKSDPLGMTTFHVLGILGQGTFAQVFKCKNVETGQLCAVKIVKNKPAYTRQAAIEIDIFIALSKENKSGNSMGINLTENQNDEALADDYMVTLLSYFMYQSHLCLVFELLGSNLYELLKRRQFRGLHISTVRSFVKQALHGTNVLSQKNIVHCDLKPENILVVSDKHIECMLKVKNSEIVHQKPGIPSRKKQTVCMKDPKCSNHQCSDKIKLIDFGSACFEGQAAHTYIQSRFYRSPEVLIGINYDAAIDMWSLGCVAAELFLGLPILPGIHEHDQLGRICEMIGEIPDWMLEQGKKSKKYFTREELKPMDENLNMLQAKELTTSSWRLKSREQFIGSLTEEEKERYGGQSKLEQQPTNRYFKRKLLGDIVKQSWKYSKSANQEAMAIFVHFLKGLLHPDPCERWTAFQASTHPFITGITFRRKNANDLNIGKGKMKITDEIYWSKPWDPSICRRILSLKRSKMSGPSNLHKSLESQKKKDENQGGSTRSHLVSPTSRVTDMACAMSISFDQHQIAQTPSTPNINQSHGMHPQLYHTPTSGPHAAHRHAQPQDSLSISLHESTNLRLKVPNLSISLHEPTNLRLDAPDVPMVPNQVMLPTLPIVGAQSFSGGFYSGSMSDGLHGELGYALQRPGVVPTGTMPMMNPIYMHHPVAVQPPPYHVPQYVNSSSFNSHSSEMGQFSSIANAGAPSHFTGPLSPQNHHSQHLPLHQDHYPHNGSYPYGLSQMQPPQQFQINPNYDEHRNGWHNLHQGNYRGRSM